MKQVKKLSPYENFHLTLSNSDSDSFSKAKLATKLGMSLQNLNYYLKPLILDGVVTKLGYATWKINKEKLKNYSNFQEVKKSSAVTNSRLPKIFTSSNDVRGHGFQFTVKIPKLENWEKRESYLKKHNIPFKPIASNKSHRITVKGLKVHLTRISIVIYAPKWKSWFADSAKSSKSHAIYDFLQVLHSIESLLNISLKIHKKYLFRVSRQHFGLVKNSLAKQYDIEGKKKLYCYIERGMWFCIDNSWNLHEAETLLPESADNDMDRIVKPLASDLDKLGIPHKDFLGEPPEAEEIMNDLKERHDQTGEVLTFSKVLQALHKTNQAIDKVVNNQLFHEANIKSHVGAINVLAESNTIQSENAIKQTQVLTEILDRLKQQDIAKKKRQQAMQSWRNSLG